MRAFFLFTAMAISSLLFFAITSCNKQHSPAPATLTHLDITGTWFYLSKRDSMFNMDGSLYQSGFYPRDTSVYGYKDCNYVTIRNDDTCIAGSCYSPGFSAFPSYYKFISDSLFSEHAIQITSPFSGFDKDTARVVSVTSSLLVLDRKGYQNSLDLYNGGYKDFYIHTIDSLYK